MNTNHEQNQSTDYIAIDISKATLQVQDDKSSLTITNDLSGLEKLITHLKSCSHPLVVFEATGGYERPLLEALRNADIPLAMVNPGRVRDFARSEGIRAKTDPIDAQMILAFAKSKQLKPMAAPSASCIELAALLDRRDHLTEQMAREKNRLQNSEAHRSIKRMIRVLEKELAAMAGVAPFNRDSGKFSGKRCIQGGRAKVRKCLYMAAHTAARCNPVIAAYVKGLRDRGKPYKCAIVAAMRKLLIHIQSLLKKAQISPC